MRQDKTLKIRANHYITPFMELLPNCDSDRAFVWSVSSDFADEEMKPETFAIKFANSDREFSSLISYGCDRWLGKMKWIYRVILNGRFLHILILVFEFPECIWQKSDRKEIRSARWSEGLKRWESNWLKYLRNWIKNKSYLCIIFTMVWNVRKNSI